MGRPSYVACLQRFYYGLYLCLADVFIWRYIDCKIIIAKYETAKYSLEFSYIISNTWTRTLLSMLVSVRSKNNFEISKLSKIKIQCMFQRAGNYILKGKLFGWGCENSAQFKIAEKISSLVAKSAQMQGAPHPAQKYTSFQVYCSSDRSK